MSSAEAGPEKSQAGDSSGSDWGLVVLGLGLAVFAAFQLFKLPPVLPVLLESYGYDRTLAGGFMSAYAVTGLLFSLPLGRLIARRGAFRMILAALAIMIAGNLLALIAPHIGWLMLACRGLEGLAFTILAIAGPVTASSRVAPRDRGIVIGLIAAWIPAGQILATLSATLVGSWQQLWLLAVAVSLATGAWTIWMRRRGHLPDPAPRLAETGDPSSRNRVDSAKPLAGMLLLLSLAAGIFFLWSGQYFAAMTWLPQYLVETQGLEVSQAALGTLLPVSVLLAFNLIAGWLLGRGLPLGLLLSLALAFQAATWWLLPYAGGQSAALGLVAMVIYGVGAGFCPTCLFAVPDRLAGGGRPQPGAFAIIMTGRNLGVLCGPLVLAEAIKATGDWNIAAPIYGSSTLLAMLLGLLLWWGFRRRGPGFRG